MLVCVTFNVNDCSVVPAVCWLLPAACRSKQMPPCGGCCRDVSSGGAPCTVQPCTNRAVLSSTAMLPFDSLGADGLVAVLMLVQLLLCFSLCLTLSAAACHACCFSWCADTQAISGTALGRAAAFAGMSPAMALGVQGGEHFLQLQLQPHSSSLENAAATWHALYFPWRHGMAYSACAHQDSVRGAGQPDTVLLCQVAASSMATVHQGHMSDCWLPKGDLSGTTVI